jgi:hypothetical protein
MSLQGVQSMIMSPQLARSKVTHNGRCCDLTDLTERSHSFSSTLSSKSMRLWYRQRNDLCHSRSENRVYIPHVFISPSITVSSYSSFDFPRLVESPSNSITNPHVYSFNGHSKFRPHVASPDSQSDSDILEENQLWC